MQDADTIVSTIEGILTKTVPNAHTKVQKRKGFGGEYVAIHIAASDFEINRVEGQWPAHVSLSLDLTDMQLNAQVFGGMGGQHIFREPDKNHPKERFLVMVSIKIPFRRPQNNMTAVSKAIEKFALNWKKAIADNIDVLVHRDKVDYAKAIS